MIPRFKPYLGFKEMLEVFLKRKNQVEIFEKKFSNYFGSNYGVAFSYGRTALYAFFKSLKIFEKEIILSSYTCSVVAHAISLSNNKPVFTDIDINTYNMDLVDLEKKFQRTQKLLL